NTSPGAKACPDGFTCSAGVCLRHSDGGAVEVKPDGPNDADAMIEVMPETMICFQPVAGCMPGTGSCDPNCQTGCGGCRQKCSVNSNGALTCNDPRTNGFAKQVMEPCTIDSDGFPSQTDNCAPGLVCVADECTPRCYKFCQTNND